MGVGGCRAKASYGGGRPSLEPECLVRREASWSMLLRCIIVHAVRASLVIVSNRQVPRGTSSHCLRSGLIRGRSFVMLMVY